MKKSKSKDVREEVSDVCTSRHSFFELSLSSIVFLCGCNEDVVVHNAALR